MKLSFRIRAFLAALTAQLLIINGAWAHGPQSFSGQVVEVIDGTTIKVRAPEGERIVRLAGLETEDIESDLGRQAREKLAVALMGRTVNVQGLAGAGYTGGAGYSGAGSYGGQGAIGERHGVGGNLDPFDGRVYLDGQDIALILLGAGLVWLLANILDDMNLHRRQEEAQRHKYGIWAYPAGRRGRPAGAFVEPHKHHPHGSVAKPVEHHEGHKPGYPAPTSSWSSGSSSVGVPAQAVNPGYQGANTSKGQKDISGTSKEKKENPGKHLGWEKQNEKGFGKVD